MRRKLTLQDFMDFSCGRRKIELSSLDMRRVKRSRRILERIAKDQPVYGTNTGIGPFFKEKIVPENQTEFQRNLILSHAAGVGSCVDRNISRGAMFLLINMLKRGYSGISPETLRALVELFNKDIIPAIPEQGSVGASGDLAPLAHIAAALIGEGYVLRDDKAIPTKYVFEFEKDKVRPIQLKPGEAIALINGTHFMTSVLSHAVWRAKILSETADAIAGLTFLAREGNPQAFNEKFSRLRSHPGQAATAKNLKSLLEENSHDSKVLQDAYSLRCIPQIHGAVKEAISFAERVVEREMNSVTGNPIIAGGRIIHGGNFHGQPLSQAADFLAIALATLGNVSERRIEGLLNPNLSGLPAFLSRKSGEDSGLMIAQYTAASLVSENKTLAHPASVDSIPLAASQEDFVSMGAWAVRKSLRVLENTAYVLAIEALCTIRASYFAGPLMAPQIIRFRNAVEERMPGFGDSHVLAGDIAEIRKLVWNGEFLEMVKSHVVCKRSIGHEKDC